MTIPNDRYRGNDGPRFSTTAILAAVVSLVFLIVALVVALTYGKGGIDSKTTPVLVMVLALIGPVLTSLVTLLKTDATRQDLHNGLIPTKVAEAVEQGVVSGEMHVKEDRTGKRERASDKKRVDDPPDSDSTGREGESVG